MGNESNSRFLDRQEWTSLSKKGCKQTIQSKKTKQIVEKYILEHIDPEDIKKESFIYEWRAGKKSSRFTIEIQEMKYVIKEEDATCFTHFCHANHEQNQRLVMYTQQIHKLYENGNKYTFKQMEQVQLFTEIFEAIDQLTQKFGYFMISKEMIGYNSKMTGKAWINQNFASNFVQYKRQVNDKGEREKWQSSIIENVIDICRLCTTDINSKANKFEYVISQIRKNRLLSFETFKEFFRRVRKDTTELEHSRSPEKVNRFNSGEKSYIVVSNEFSNSKAEGAHSNGKEVITSTKQYKNSRVIKEKRFVMVPVINIKKIYPVSEEERLMINNHFRNSDHLSKHNRQNSMIVQNHLRQNYVEVERHSHSYMKLSNEDYHVHSEITKPLDSIIEQPQGLNDISSNMKNDSGIIAESRSQILMVDSMIVVENQFQNDESLVKNTKVILQESIILRGNEKE